MKFIANLLSIIFLPLLMPVYGLLICFYSFSIQKSAYAINCLYDNPNKESFLYLFGIFCFLAPALSLVLLRYNNTVSSIGLENKDERKTPILITALYFFILFVFLSFQGKGLVPPVLLGTSLAGAIASILAYFINLKTKISLHTLGAGSLLGFMVAYFQTQAYFNFSIIYLAIAIGILSSLARLYLNKHNVKQIGLGYLVGFLAQMIIIAIYYNLSEI